MPKTMKGVLDLYWETGTEGAYWVFEDDAYLSTRIETKCRKCGRWWNPEKPEFEPDGDKPIENTGLIMRSCKKGEHDVGPVEVPTRDYEGLHILKTGDRLTVYSKDDPSHVLWEGNVQLTPFTVYKDTWGAYWIHNKPKNIDIDVWGRYFLDGHPAQLIIKGK